MISRLIRYVNKKPTLIAPTATDYSPKCMQRMRLVNKNIMATNRGENPPKPNSHHRGLPTKSAVMVFDWSMNGRWRHYRNDPTSN